jgi:hypothetical protein
MFGRLKTVLVESFVGAIALGWVFAQAILHLISAVTAPISEWEQQRFLSELRVGDHLRYPLLAWIPELIAAIALAAVGLLLLRWLYYTPIASRSAGPDETTLNQPS